MANQHHDELGSQVEPARNFIVVLSDMETYCGIEGCSIVALTDAQLEEAENGGEKAAIRQAIDQGFQVTTFSQTESGRTMSVNYLIADENA